MWVAFAATHIFSAKNIRILYIESAKIVNEMTLNELVKLTTLWTNRPRFVADNSKLHDVYIIFSVKIRFDISCKSSARQTIRMKIQDSYLRK